MGDVSVLLLDDDQDLRRALSQLFMAAGVDCVGVGSLEEMIAVGARGLACNVAILDVNLGHGRPSGVDAFHWLKAQSFPGRIVFLTGHARSVTSVVEARALGVAVLQKPISVAGLLELVGVDASTFR